MKLSIRGMGFDLTEAIITHVRHRLHNGLSHYVPGLRTIVVRVSDVNGPHHGGADKHCHLEVTAAGNTTAELAFVVDEVHADLYRAIDLTVARMRRRLAREYDRRRTTRLSRRVSASGLPT